ncbi:hypothetical protein DV737_g3652, partial [Chaetothyriales sp. CBS 132003]
MTLPKSVRKRNVLASLAFLAAVVWLFSDRTTDSICLSFESLVGISICSRAFVNSEWNLFYHLGGNGPWIPKRDRLGDVTDRLPAHCVVDQVHMVCLTLCIRTVWLSTDLDSSLAMPKDIPPEMRETVRTRSRSEDCLLTLPGHLNLLDRLRAPGVKLGGALSFLNSWSYFTNLDHPEFENLTNRGPYAGTLQALNAGKKLRQQYNHLVSRDQPTRFWSCSAERDIETARWFAEGFWGPHWEDDGSAELHIIPEDAERGGDTLTPGTTCHRYRTEAYGHDYGYRQMDIWQKTFGQDIAQRLAPDAEGVILTAPDVYSMMEMCGFELLARGYSSWCSIFSHSDWLRFEYARDLLHFYRAGPGSEFAGALGWLYLNATAELLVTNNATHLYLSFVHDGDIVPVLAALQVLDEKTIQQHLPTDTIKSERTWRTSDVVPMGGRLVLERIACSGEDQAETRHYVRISINDGIVKVAGIPPAKEVDHTVDVADFWDFVASRLGYFGEFREVCGLRADAPDRISFLHQ